MKIAINALCIGFANNAQRSGTSRYAENLLLALSKLDSSNQYLVLLRNDEKHSPLLLGTNFTKKHAPSWANKPRGRIFWENLAAPSLVRQFGADIYHCLLNASPFRFPCPTLVTIHDLAPFVCPETYPIFQRFYQQWAIGHSVRKASYLFTPTQAVQNQIVERFSVSDERIVATGEGANSEFRPFSLEATSAWRKTKGLPEVFFLFVGNLEPRKNLLSLLRAYADWKKTRNSPVVPLYIVGAKAWKYSTTLSAISELGLNDCVVLQGYAPDSELPYWYNCAQSLIYPSSYEGFGLPPLEAMACGCPVVTSLDPALREVGADTAVALDPNDTRAFSLILEQMTHPSSRSIYSKKSLDRASKFSWDKTANHTLQTYLHCLPMLK